MSIFSCNTLKYIFMNNQECKVRPEIININSNEPLFYPHRISANECSGSYNNINDLYAKLCVPDVVKSINVRVFNREIMKQDIKWYDTSKCKCRLGASVCNNKQCWNKDKCRCELKELIDKVICDKGFIWNPSICECECDKLYDIRQYFD